VFFRITAALTGDTGDIPVLDLTQIGREPDNYYGLFFFPQLCQHAVLYAAFLLLNFVVVPRLVARKALILDILFGLSIILLLGVALATIDTYLKHYLLSNFDSVDYAWFYFFRERTLYAVWLALVFGFYSVAQYGAVHVLEHLERYRERYPFLTLGGMLGLIMWLISLFFIVAIVKDRNVIAVWAVFWPSTLIFYWYASYRLIPRSLKRRKPFRAYLLRAFLVLLSAFLPVGAIATLIAARAETGFPAGVLNSVFQFLVTAPVTWVLYLRSARGSEELAALKQKLGQSRADIDFLRSQINPHFLFNALNTIYGTAIQEQAERSAEGVQRLGDMMRFMLQENTQDQIPLAREIEYLHNYISLQKLRTDSHPGISIRADIEEEVTTARIAPMLLIPFVENAFKHGISFREPSYIKIGLELRGETLNFDVHNSRHDKPDHDPERDKGGIGLVNVRQRLELLYPDRHELMIRETGKEFFVHLTIQLG
jgi:hypothetical protein